MSIEIRGKDFLSQNGYQKSFRTLQQQSGIGLNVLKDYKQFLENIRNGKWELIIKQIQHMQISEQLYITLFQRITQQLIEINQFEGANYLFYKCIKSKKNQQLFPEKVLRLEYLLEKGKSDQQLYQGQTKEERRQQLAKAFFQQIAIPQPQRLLTLLGQSIKHQQMNGQLIPGIKIDIFLNEKEVYNEQKDEVIKNLQKTIKYPNSTKIQQISFSNFGKYLAVGTSQGIIQIYNTISYSIDIDLEYQKQKNPMFHKSSIVSLSFNQTDQLLASADSKNSIKVWKIANGKCLKKFLGEQVGINLIKFPSDSSQLITAYNDIQVVGLKSGKTIKTFKGHSSIVNDIYIANEKTLISCSKDFTIKLWNFNTTQMLKSHTITQGHIQRQPYSITMLNQSKLMVGIYGNQLKFISLDLSNQESILTKQKVKYFNQNQEFVASVLGKSKSYIYAVGVYEGKNTLYVFNSANRKTQFFTDLAIYPNCFKAHPTRNTLVIGSNNIICFYRP